MSTSSIFGSAGRAPRRSIPAQPSPRPRAAHPGPESGAGGDASGSGPGRRDDWIGVDLARWAAPTSSHTWLALVALALGVALGVAALRIDLIRTRYALADAMEREASLLAEQRELIARQRQLRDPTVLARLAQERGFRPAAASRVLTDPMPGDASRVPILPSISAPPPDVARSHAVGTDRP